MFSQTRNKIAFCKPQSRKQCKLPQNAVKKFVRKGFDVNISESVAKAVRAGVAPLELQYRAIRACNNQQSIAFRSEAVLNSLELGVLTQSQFAEAYAVSDPEGVGLRVTDWAIARALEARSSFSDEEKTDMFVSVACPVAYAEQSDFYNRLKNLLKVSSYDPKKGAKLCLEFPDSLLLSEKDVKTAMLDAKLLGVKTMIVCKDASSCPLMKLVEIPVDYVVLSAETTALLQSRNKPGVFAALVQLVHSLNAAVVADGVQTTEQMRQLTRLNCEGYIHQNEQPVSSED